MGAAPKPVDVLLRELTPEPLPKPAKPEWFSISDEIVPTNPSVVDIQRATCKHFGLGREEFLSQRREHRIVVPRQIAMYLCKIHTTRSFPEIGRRYGGKDHTTVMHAVRKIEGRIPKDWLLAHDVAHIERQL